MADFSGKPMTMVRGDTVKIRFAVTVAGQAEDISGWRRFLLSAKTALSVSDAAATVQLTSDPGGGISVLDGPAGLGEAIIPAASTRTLTNQRQNLFAELQGTDGSGYVWTLSRWYLQVLPEVIQDS